MKRIIAILLMTALLSTATACTSADSNKAPADTTTTASTTAPEIPDDTLLVAEGYDINFTEYLEIPDLSTVKASLAELNESWETVADSIRYENITFTDAGADDVAALADEVNIHYKGYSASDDVTFSESTLSGMTNFDYDNEGNLLDGDALVLGSNSFIGAYESEEHPEKNNPGFEEQLVGAKAGETRTITVTFPDDYGSEELNGAVVKFDVTVNSMRKGTLPELTDAMVSDYFSEEYTTISAAKDYVIDFYKSSLAFVAVMDAITVKRYPEEALNNTIDDYIENYIANNYEEELTEEEHQKVYDEQYEDALASAETIVSERLRLEYLFKAFNISLTQAEYIEARDADFEENSLYYMYYYGISDVESLELAFGKDYMVTQYKYDKLTPLVADTVVFE